MAENSVKIECPGSATEYEIRIVHGSLAGAGRWARKCLDRGAQRIAVVSNPKVFGLYGETLADSLTAAGFEVAVWLMKDGERYKNMRSLDAALAFFGESGLSRTDAVVALGGGVVGDLAGFAASVYLRGVAFLQIPTTLLAMIDSSVGGKTGVNTKFGKNTIGAFYQPLGVLIDPITLSTLPGRELTAGFCEAIKNGALAGTELFRQTAGLLEKYRPDKFSVYFHDVDFQNELRELIASQVAFKAGIVRGDERESASRTDARSRKILNFGHTLAHALEKVTEYKYLKHGEAVGYGIIYAAELSKMLAFTDEKVVKLLNGVVHRAGHLPPLNDLDPKGVLEAFRFDKKLVSGSLQMILLKGIGEPVIVNGEDIPHSFHIKALKQLLNK